MGIPLTRIKQNCCDSHLSTYTIIDGDSLDNSGSTCDKIIECIDKYILIEEKSMSFGFSSRNPRVLILPMYLLWIFSLSKLIVIFYNKDFTEDFIIKIIILSIIFICSFIAWFKFKKTSNKTWSFWVTFFAVSYILINVFWEYFLQYLQSYFSTINCIFKTIITI